MNHACVLCLNPNTGVFYSQKSGVNWELYGFQKNLVKDLIFYRCSECGVIFKDPEIRLNPTQEKLRYGEHENNANDPRYEEFLTPLVEAVSQRIPMNAEGLDFGCGPTLVTEELFGRKKIACKSYDLYFLDDKSLLERKYDFIICSEAAEHFYNPHKEFERLFSLLKEKGVLGIKTVLAPEDFANWWYHKDPTHVTFYSRITFEWLAKKYGYRVEFLPKDVTLLRCLSTFHTKRSRVQIIL